MSSLALPPEVTALLGRRPERLTGYGESVALRGQGKVAKIGPASVTAREARILDSPVGSLPLRVPRLLAEGDGWLVMEEVANIGATWDEREFAALLPDLAQLHDAFESSSWLEGGWLRDPTGADLAATLAEGADRAGVELPEPITRVLENPQPVADALARSGPATLVHGDPTPANVLRAVSPDRRVWIDWEWASRAPAGVDLACWLNEGPWQFGRRLDRDRCLLAYLDARSRPVDRRLLERSLDAALVIFFFANNLNSLAREAGRDALQSLIAECREALERLDRPQP